MTAGRYDFVIEQGATLERTITWTDNDGNAIDITGWTVRLQARESVDDAATVLDLDNAGKGGLSIPTGTDGVIELSVSDEDTAALTFERAYYDLEGEDTGGKVFRILEGVVHVSEEVTR